MGIKAVLFVVALFGGVAVQAQPAPNIIEVPIFTHFQCDNGGQLRVISQVDRGVYDIQYADVLALVRGTFQYTPGTNGGGVFDYPAYFQSSSNQIGRFSFVADEAAVYMQMALWLNPARCLAVSNFDVTDL